MTIFSGHIFKYMQNIHRYMPKKTDEIWTTLRVEKSTREIINQLAESNNLNVNDLLKGIAKGTTQPAMQVLLNFGPERQQILNEVTKILHTTGVITKPTLHSTVSFAVDNLINGVTKNLESQNAPHDMNNIVT